MDEELENKENFISSLDPRKNHTNFFLFLFVAILIIGGIGVSINTVQKTAKQNENTSTTKSSPAFTSIAPRTLVYGYGTDKNSYIEAVDLNSGKVYALATLDLNIKKVTVTSSESMIFINKTDARDYGREISTFNFGNKSVSSTVLADTNYGIDDYVVSPNKRYIATWEISVPENSQGLIGGKSRVYAVDINSPQRKNIIYDEPISNGSFMHYPLAITDRGEIYMDKFEANSQAGWANGISVSDFSGTVKEEIPSMSSGTLSSQPILSPDGKKLVFAGYDGSKGPGNVSLADREGFRQALLNPNTIEIFDTLGRQRTKLTGILNTNRYPFVSWDSYSGKIIYFTLSKSLEQNGFYLYDPITSSTQKLRGEIATSQDSVLSTLGDNNILVGVNNTSVSTVGNLGEKYSQTLNEIGIYNTNTKERARVNIGKNPIQYIGLLPSALFNDSQATGNLGSSSKENVSTLQLKTITLKSELGPKRITQQSKPACKNIATEQCNSMLGTNFSPDQRSSTPNSEYNSCFKTQFALARTDGVCMDSPLYLYGKPGTYIKIKIGTQIYGSNAPYKGGSYEGFLTGDGGLKVENQLYSNINFNYTSALRKLPQLNYGKTVKSEEVPKTLEEYGKKLGLNLVEIKDLIASIGKFSSSYVFVSFFDNETSKAILPISFNPIPDTYRNIVFYLKPLEDPIVSSSSKFPGIPQRKGLAAIEVSYIIDE
ncbi:MAG: hypothetical protein A2958_02110 [Candidatus Levybacteria bacterium RIFCSPLOWO2_01_FULL_38_13]|nr:MAG: hypothetical protein A2958_02110 [Candidatus Levybacteria bacterium RIFCSPLOWO2_01_FULL_38_13]